MLKTKRTAELSLTIIAFFLCIPSGASVLMKVYGVCEMSVTVPLLVVPSCVALVSLFVIASRLELNSLIADLGVGYLGGVLGTAGYDLFRVPFHLVGFRVFVPIQVYGVWALDSTSWSIFTEYTGWLYHATNGITFSIALLCFYRLCCLKNPLMQAILAILYAMGLETLAIVSPFAVIFHLSGNTSAILIAYAGHFAYGLPIAWLVYRREHVLVWLSQLSTGFKRLLMASGIALLVAYLFAALVTGAHSRSSSNHQITVTSEGFEPRMIKLTRGEVISFRNATDSALEIAVQGRTQTLKFGERQSREVEMDQSGIYQVREQSNRQNESAFVIVEPVSEAH